MGLKALLSGLCLLGKTQIIYSLQQWCIIYILYTLYVWQDKQPACGINEKLKRKYNDMEGYLEEEA